MRKTESFREQHAKLLKVASKISAHLRVDELSKDASEARSLLSELLGTLRIHLAMEDSSLYPKLLEHSDEQIRSMAKKFVDEMGGIGEAVKSYGDKWPHAKAIQENPNDFVKETEGLLATLADRIKKEDNELYAAVDEMSSEGQ